MRITTENSSVPYLVSLVGREILSSGLPLDISFKMARRIKYSLKKIGIEECRKEFLRLIIIKILKNLHGDYQKNYIKYLKLNLSEKPFVILMAGVPGVGKSAIAAELAYRFNIDQIVDTDIIREVMRFFYNEKKDAAIFKVSHNAWEVYGKRTKVNILKGFKGHVKSVIPGIIQVINRTLSHKRDVIIEGVHILPSELQQFLRRENIYLITVIVESEKEHKNKFYLRAEQLHHVSVERYFENFEQIRLIQDYLIEESKKYNIPIFNNYNMEEVINSISARILLAS